MFAKGFKVAALGASLVFGPVCGGMLAAAAEQGLSLTIVSDKDPIILTQAKMEISSSRGYAMGRGFQNFSGLYVTDAFVPPEGIQLQKSLVNWNSIKEVRFLEWRAKAGTDMTAKAQLILRDGTTKEVFLWNPSMRDGYSGLSSFEIRIVGKTVIGGIDRDVVVEAMQTWRSLVLN